MTCVVSEIDKSLINLLPIRFLHWWTLINFLLSSSNASARTFESFELSSFCDDDEQPRN
jgi:hypothetical protein